MDKKTIDLIVSLIGAVAEKGVPIFMKFTDGTILENPTAEDFRNLKVEKMPG